MIASYKEGLKVACKFYNSLSIKALKVRHFSELIVSLILGSKTAYTRYRALSN